MTEHQANDTAESRIRHYLKLGTRRARLRESLRLSAAVCQQKLSVEEAYQLHGLKLDDVMRYLAISGYLASPPPEPAELQAVAEPTTTPQTGVRLNQIV